MPNSYFKFKEFTVYQEKSAMKVCTDSCILGAWASRHIQRAEKILDIGTGTGLLALMLAQKSKAVIEGIESDPGSFIQATENILQSPWSNRIRIIDGDARHFYFSNKYDFIISNPPFYASDLHSPDQKKNKARHEVSLTLDELITVILSCLQKTGFFIILLPYHRAAYFEKLAASNGFFLQEKLTIRQTPKHPPFRTISLFGHEKKEDLIPDELMIKDSAGKYDKKFFELLKDYYPDDR
jgi:tRNA1Val (adenine37-N6)-methyltransferase